MKGTGRVNDKKQQNGDNEEVKSTICRLLQNEGNEEIELRKIHQLVPDEEAARDGYLRMVDQSGEDYLYPQEYFIRIDLPPVAEEALLSAA